MGPALRRFKQERKFAENFSSATRGRSFWGFPENFKIKRFDVRFSRYFVRFTPESGHYSGTPICQFLTHSGHYERS